MDLFTQSFLSLYREWPADRKIKFLEEILEEVGKIERPVISFKSDTPSLSGKSKISSLAVEILSYLFPYLFPTYELSHDNISYSLHPNVRDHPYLIRIIRRIGRLAFSFPLDTKVKIKYLSLPITDILDSKEEEFSLPIRYINLEEIKERAHLQPVKSQEEVDKIIDFVLQKKGIFVNPEEVEKWVKEAMEN